jgi:hypothetical protein
MSQDFQASFTFAQTPGEVFDAVTNVRGWWSEALEGDSLHQGDEFTYRHADIHYSRHRLVEVIPDQRMVWLTLDGSINFVDDKAEWNGTRVIFEVVESDGQTTLHFTHEGLTPQLDCFEGCSGGWRYYLESLQELIVNGKGKPDPVNR